MKSKEMFINLLLKSKIYKTYKNVFDIQTIAKASKNVLEYNYRYILIKVLEYNYKYSLQKVIDYLSNYMKTHVHEPET